MATLIIQIEDEEETDSIHAEENTPQPIEHAAQRIGRHMSHDYTSMVSLNESLSEGWMSKQDHDFISRFKPKSTVQIEIPEYESDEENNNFLPNTEHWTSKDILRKLFEMFGIDYVPRDKRHRLINYVLPIPEQPKNVIEQRRFNRRFSTIQKKDVTLDPPNSFDETNRMHYLKFRDILVQSLFITPQIGDLDEMIGIRYAFVRVD
jgi:hypothetical protein